MTKLILIYAASVLLKWAYEALDAIAADRKAGVKGWWDGAKYDQMKKLITHVPLCVAWVTGAALAAVNSIGAGVGMGEMTAVTPANTIMAAWFLDSFGKPLAKRLKRKEQEA